MLTSVCTGLGAFSHAQWIPVTMAISAGFAAALAYTQVSYLRLIDFCVTQLKAQGPSRTCNESKEEGGGDTQVRCRANMARIRQNLALAFR